MLGTVLFFVCFVVFVVLVDIHICKIQILFFFSVFDKCVYLFWFIFIGCLEFLFCFVLFYSLVFFNGIFSILSINEKIYLDPN